MRWTADPTTPPGTILAPLSADQRERLAGAMAEVQRLLRASGVA